MLRDWMRTSWGDIFAFKVIILILAAIWIVWVHTAKDPGGGSSSIDPAESMNTLGSATLEFWEGIYVGMPAEDVLLVHPLEEMSQTPKMTGNDSDGLITLWSYPDAHIVMAKRVGECPKGEDSLECYCYRVIRIHSR